MQNYKQKLDIRNIGFVLGPLLFSLVLLIPSEALSFEAKIVLGLSLWMGTWWVTETIPIYVTALLPLVIFPMASITDIGRVSLYYADRIVFLLLGGSLVTYLVQM